MNFHWHFMESALKTAISQQVTHLKYKMALQWPTGTKPALENRDWASAGPLLVLCWQTALAHCWLCTGYILANGTGPALSAWYWASAGCVLALSWLALAKRFWPN